MLVDYNGIAVVIAAVAAGIASLTTTFLQVRSEKKTESNKQEAIVNRTLDTNAILSGQQNIAEAVNIQLLIVARARVDRLKERLEKLGGETNGIPPTTLENAADVIDKLEQRLHVLTPDTH